MRGVGRPRVLLPVYVQGEQRLVEMHPGALLRVEREPC
jgi:hypothetical protein